MHMTILIAPITRRLWEQGHMQICPQTNKQT